MAAKKKTPPPERTVDAALVPVGWEVFDFEAGRWLLVKRVEDPGGGWIVYHTDDGERRVSFFTRQAARPKEETSG